MNEFYNKLPFSITWYLTRNCNLNCKFCYFVNEQRDEISLEQAQKIVQEIMTLKPVSVCLIGGEIFLNPHVFHIIQLLNEANIVVHLATNGTLLSDANIRKLTTYNIGSIQISLDGSTPEVNDPIRGSGTFVKVIDVINKLTKNGLQVDIAPLICKKNKNDILNIIELAENLKIDNVRFNLFIPSGKGKNVLNEYTLTHQELEMIFKDINLYEEKRDLRLKINKPCFANFYKMVNHPQSNPTKNSSNRLTSYGCQAGRRKLAILPNGDVIGCEMLEDDVNGNLFERSLLSIWQSPDSFLKWREPEPLKGKCNKCSVLQYCLGGCRANSYLYNGDFYSEDPLCWLKC